MSKNKSVKKEVKTENKAKTTSKKATRRVMYLRDNKYMPVGCIAISLNKDRSQVKYQLSVLNPVDKFERSLARHIALGRLLEMPYKVDLKGVKADKYWINCAVMESIANSKKIPARARKAAKAWLEYNTDPQVDMYDE